MATHKSALKRARQNEVQRVRNKGHMSAVRTVVKNFRTAIEDLKEGKGDAAATQKLLVSAQSSLMKAASKGLIHSNNASRKVSRLANAYAKATKK